MGSLPASFPSLTSHLSPGLSSTLATKPIAQTPAMAPSLKTYNPQWTESALRNKITRAAAAAAAPKCSLSRR
jgi:hypothetical protein